MIKEDIFDELKKYWSNDYVTRKDLKKITGGLLCGRTMEKLDHAEKGIRARVIVAGRTVYHIDDLIAWLKANVRFVNFEGKEN